MPPCATTTPASDAATVCTPPKSSGTANCAASRPSAPTVARPSGFVASTKCLPLKRNPSSTTQPPSTVPQVRSTMRFGGRPSAVASMRAPTIACVFGARVSVSLFGCAGDSRFDARTDSRHAGADSDANNRMANTRRTLLLDDRELRSFDFERLEFAGASVLVGRRHRVAEDADGRVLRHDPLGDPELPLRLRGGCAVAHRNVECLGAVVQVDDELSGFLAIAGLRIRDEHPPADRLATLEAVSQYAIVRMARRLEERHV